MNKMQFKKKPGIYVTKLFGEFIRGVTYFNNEVLNDFFPIYHRLSLCCKNTKHKKSERKKIKKCYIERLIYNDIYLHNTLNFPTSAHCTEHTQDDGHVEALNRIKIKFDECFPNREIVVDMKYVNEYPTELEITETYRGNIISIEKYSRNLLSDKKYAYNVVAMKIKDGVIRQRDQNFTHIFPWKVVTPAPACDHPDRF
jgi:hypothetical protein